MDDFDDLNRKADDATADYLRRSSIAFLECAINLMMSHMTPQHVAHILREEADIIEDYG